MKFYVKYTSVYTASFQRKPSICYFVKIKCTHLLLFVLFGVCLFCFNFFCLFLKQGLTVYPKLALNSKSSLLQPPEWWEFVTWPNSPLSSVLSHMPQYAPNKARMVRSSSSSWDAYWVVSQEPAGQEPVLKIMWLSEAEITLPCTVWGELRLCTLSLPSTTVTPN